MEAVDFEKEFSGFPREFSLLKGVNDPLALAVRALDKLTEQGDYTPIVQVREVMEVAEEAPNHLQHKTGNVGAKTRADRSYGEDGIELEALELLHSTPTGKRHNQPGSLSPAVSPIVLFRRKALDEIPTPEEPETTKKELVMLTVKKPVETPNEKAEVEEAPPTDPVAIGPIRRLTRIEQSPMEVDICEKARRSDVRGSTSKMSAESGQAVSIVREDFQPYVAGMVARLRDTNLFDAYPARTDSRPPELHVSGLPDLGLTRDETILTVLQETGIIGDELIETQYISIPGLVILMLHEDSRRILEKDPKASTLFTDYFDDPSTKHITLTAIRLETEKHLKVAGYKV